MPSNDNHRLRRWMCFSILLFVYFRHKEARDTRKNNIFRKKHLSHESGLKEITCRAMMGEYILYYRGQIVVGIYNNRLLVKPVKSAVFLMPTATYELPYEGAKEMLLVDNVDSKEFLTELFDAMYEELPTPKKKEEGNSWLLVLHTT